MYEFLHSDRLFSNPINGFLFVAQLVGGKLTFGAQLTTPLGKFDNVFYLSQYQWEQENPYYVIDIGPFYAQTFQGEEVQQWIKEVVEPWVREEKLKHLDTTIKNTLRSLEEMYAESLVLQTHKDEVDNT